MTLAAFLIPPSLDVNQALRLRRFGVGSLSYVLATALVAIAWLFGVIQASIVLEVAVAFVTINMFLYGAILTGFNLRFEDPSLTRAQIVCAITVLMYIVYHMDAGRSVALFGCFIVFQFGISRLRAREFVAITLYTLAAYALVINLLMYYRPQAIHDVPGEWMSWLGLAGFLPCMNFVGGQINTLRRRMRESDARFRGFAQLGLDWYYEQDGELRYTRFDGKVPEQYKDLFAKFLGKRHWEIGHDCDGGWDAFQRLTEARLPFRDFVHYRVRRNGERRYFADSADPLFDETGKFIGYRGVGRDVTVQKAAEELVQHRATHDSLTGLPNRAMFSALLEQALRSAKRHERKLAIFFIDLDGFKAVNDLLGHDAGDSLLRQMAKRFCDAVRTSDVVVRLGGDEFGVLGQDLVERDGVAVVAQKLLGAAAQPMEVAGKECRVGASIGISVFPDDGDDEHSLLKKADQAMYAAKRGGKNAFRFSS